MASICSNCYSNCVETTSDKCVKYTGLDIAVLGIQNGDSINYVTSAIVGFLVSTLDASGIKYELEPENLCTIISDELVDCADITQKDISNAIAAAVCGLDERVSTLESSNTTLEASYTPDCVPGITGTEGTHAVVQAVIDHLCTVTTDLDALELNVSNNYVLISDINTYISNYITNNPNDSGNQRDKMVPYTVVEYYGPLNVFDGSGAGLNDWEQIYLCNGDNGTPDKRGRIPVGTTSGMGGGSFPNATDPLIAGNPTYNLYTTNGANTVALTQSELPSHTHSTTTTTQPHHQHYLVSFDNSGTSLSNPELTIDESHSTGGNLGYALTGNTGAADSGVSSEAGEHTHTVTVNPTGGGSSHNNIPPVLACHYIIYIPTV